MLEKHQVEDFVLLLVEELKAMGSSEQPDWTRAGRALDLIASIVESEKGPVV